tara:strand:- start:368 stop:943 length:576 start_codon:yes stop_codon:yes gene_type:complete
MTTIDEIDTVKYPLIQNPFVKLDSFVKPRLTLQKDPINKKGNTDYTEFYESNDGIEISNELDPKLNYFIGVNMKEKKVDDMVIPFDESMIDYSLSAEQLNNCRTDGKELHKDPLPISFLNIKTEAEGLLWYRRTYPKIPDDLLPIIARYHWGDNINKDTIKKEKKKNKKKEAPKTISVKTDPNNPFILTFK